jgi:hypothetical protein
MEDSPRWHELKQTLAEPTTGLRNITNGDLGRSYGKAYASEHGNVYLAVRHVSTNYDYRTLQRFTGNISFPLADIELPAELVEYASESTKLGTVIPDGYSWATVVSEHGYVSAGHSPQDQERSQYARHVNNGHKAIFQTEDTIFWVKYAFAEKRPGASKIQISLHFMAVVIICNVVKIAAMATTLADSSEEPLATVGDAISAFMKDPDPYTTNHCNTSIDDIVRNSSKPKQQRPCHDEDRAQPDTVSQEVWTRKKKALFPAVSRPIRIIGAIL